MKTAEDVLDNFTADVYAEGPVYSESGYSYFTVIKAMEEYANQFRQADVSGLLPSIEEFAEQKEKYLKTNGFDSIGSADKIWKDAVNWALKYVASKGNSR